MKSSLVAFLILLLSFSQIFSHSMALAADVKKIKDRLLLFQFDPTRETFKEGNIYSVYRKKQKIGKIKIQKIKNKTARGERLEGDLLPGDIVSSTDQEAAPIQSLEPPSTESPSPITLTVTVLSNYLWRGITLSNNSAVLQGGLDALHSSGFGAGVFISSTGGTASGTSETDFYFSETLTPFSNFKLSFGVYRYTYQKQSNLDAWDYLANFSLASTRLDLSHIPNYANTQSSDNYIKLTQSFLLHPQYRLNMSCGRSTFNKESLVGHKSYNDGRIGLAYTSKDNFNIELAWSITDRKNLEGQSLSDEASSLSFSKTFD